jgi:hypothetical protein
MAADRKPLIKGVGVSSQNPHALGLSMRRAGAATEK